LTKQLKVYVASSWKNLHQPVVVQALQDVNHYVYDFRNPHDRDAGFSWGDVSNNWENWNTEDFIQGLKHPAALRGFQSDMTAMNWADICVLVLPSGRSSHSEAGWFVGQYKPVFIYSPEPCEPKLMYKMYSGIFSDLYKLIEAI